MRLCVALLLTVAARAAETDPTFLRASVDAAAEAPSELTTEACRYKPLFGAGSGRHASAPRSVARYGIVLATGECKAVTYLREEQILFILDGQGSLHYRGAKHGVKKDDFVYLPPAVEHRLSGQLRAVWMGFRVPADPPPFAHDKPAIANLADVPKQVVGNHPPSTLYQLMIGNRESKRDNIAAGLLMNSLFVMEFAPGGTNAPHHHEREEEVYLVLDGAGEIVAGGGSDGLEGRFPAKPGDAYFYRLNTTVGFYNDPAGPKARILAVRSAPPAARAKE
jgi:mannose-6-phosphate isomerase-like protein (cupin superfamily)